MDPTRFIILCAARTGSTMLRFLINSHPEICCHGEVLGNPTRGFVGVEAKAPIQTKLDELRKADPVRFMHEFVFYTASQTVVGFKIKYEELTQAGYADVLRALVEDPSIKVIHLTRENLLKRFISHVSAMKLYEQRQIYNVTTPGELPPRQPLTLTPEECFKNFKMLREREAHFRAQFREHDLIEVTYEQITAPDSPQIPALLRFLGVSEVELSTPTRKLNPDHLPDILENYEEIVRSFRGTPYESFLAL